MKEQALKNISLGDSASFEKTIAESDIYLFAGVSGDFNPIHINSEKAKASPFKKRIAHGMLVGSLISTVLGEKLPGNGSIYLGQNLRFLKPVFIGDTIKAKVVVKEIKNVKKIVILATYCVNQNGENVIEGEAVIKVP